ncbi:hypothetical protein [Nostoc sp.]
MLPWLFKVSAIASLINCNADYLQCDRRNDESSITRLAIERTHFSVY